MTERHVTAGRKYVAYGSAECHTCKQQHKQFIDVILHNDEFNLCIACALKLRDQIAEELERYVTDKWDVDLTFEGSQE